MNKTELQKETAIQNEQQSNTTYDINEELHEMNQTLKEISATLFHIMQYGIITKG